MKLVSWNCNGALRKKTASLDAIDADIFVIQECENPDTSTTQYKQWAGDYLWVGTNKNRGLGVFARKQNVLTELDWRGEHVFKGSVSNHRSLTWSSSDLQSFLPCKINGKFTVVGVWTKQNSSPNFRYIGQFWKYLQVNKQRLSGHKTILCGDFNSNTIWDEPDRWWNHSDVVSELDEMGIHSIYHSQSGFPQGQERTPTFYMHRKLEKPYHIDYAFVSHDLLGGSMIEFGNPHEWLAYSDHVPLFIEVGEV
ncbi:endonuclease/exonuclease/phosphatase family protein [Pseudomonadota bacterium]